MAILGVITRPSVGHFNFHMILINTDLHALSANGVCSFCVCMYALHYILDIISALGESRLREVFLKTSNDMNGQYFAQIIKVRSCYYLSIVV